MQSKYSEYARNAQGRYDCPHCDADFSQVHNALRHVANSCKRRLVAQSGNIPNHLNQNCPTVFPAKKKKMMTLTVNNDPVLPISSRVSVLWEGERYPATVVGRTCWFDVRYDDGSYGEGLTVDKHELELLGMSVAAGGKSAQKRKAVPICDGCGVEFALPVSLRRHMATSCPKRAMPVKLKVTASLSPFQSSISPKKVALEAEETDGMQQQPQKKKPTVRAAAAAAAGAAIDDVGVASSADEGNNDSSSAATMNFFKDCDLGITPGNTPWTVESMKATIGVAQHAQHIARNCTLENASLKKANGSLKIALDAVQKIADHYMQKASSAEEVAKYHEDETGTMHIFSGKQTSTIDRLKELALKAGVDVGIVNDAAKVN